MALTERESILNDFEVAKRLLKQMQDHFTTLESKVSKIRDNQWTVRSVGFASYEPCNTCTGSKDI